MTPIDDELRTALHRRAAAVAPTADPLAGIEHRAARIRRRRMTAAVAGSALAVTAVVLPVALVQMRAETGRAGAVAGGGSPSPSRPAGTGSPTVDDRQPANALSWAYSYQVPDDGLSPAAVHAFAASHHRADDEVVVSPLYVARLPKGYYAYVFQAWFRTHRPAADGTIEFTSEPSPARTVVYLTPVPYKPGVIPAAPAAGILRDEVTPAGVRQISQILPGDQYPLVLVLGNPRTTGQISYARDGRTLVPVRRLHPVDDQPGLALFLRTGPAIGQQRADLVELRDTQGRVSYRGPIDVGPSAPDV